MKAKNSKFQILHFKSFTLIGILITIGLIIFLISITITAINPIRQFAQARNAQRRANIGAILDAIYQNSMDNRGVFNCHHSIPTSTSTISSSDVDIYDCLVPTYIADLPYDPSEGYFNSKTDYDTKYQIKKDPNTGRVIIYAPEAELGEQISIVGSSLAVRGGVNEETWIQTSQSDFQAGVLANIDVTSSPGDVKLAVDTSNWYDSSWNYRRGVTITTGSASTPANYQVKIDVSYDSDMLADFADIRFTDSDGKTLIDHWRESFLASNSAVFWVEIPDSIPANSSKTIYMYYGNSSASSASNATNTFVRVIDGTQSVKGSWHFDEGSEITVYDTSGNDNDGTLTNMDPTTDWVDGKFGRALKFDGVNDYVEVPDSASLDITDAITIEAWVKKSELSRIESIVSKGPYSLKIGSDNKPYVELIADSEAIADVGQLGKSDYVYSLAVYDGKLYGGTGRLGRVYRYDGGTTWTDVGRLGANKHVYSLAVYDGKLYGGTGDSGRVYRYDGGTTWTDVGRLGKSDYVYSLAVYDGKLYGGTGDSGRVYSIGQGTAAYSDTAITTEYTHICGIYDGSNSKIYVDGNERGSDSQTITIDTETFSLWIGASLGSTKGGFSSSGEDFFNGIIDEVRVYNRALSVDEISDLYNYYGYTTENYPGRVLVRKYISPEPTSSVESEEGKQYYPSGTIASQVLDTDHSEASWDELSWSETLPSEANITFEVRASNSSFTKDASSPSWIDLGTADSPVTSGLPSGRYMQWRATLSRTDSNTPTLHDVTIKYSW